jgi:hypothetical protein
MQITAPLSRVVGPLASRISAPLVLIPEGPESSIAKGACYFIRAADCDHYTMPVPSLVSSAVSVSPGSGSVHAERIRIRGRGVDVDVDVDVVVVAWGVVMVWLQLARVRGVPTPVSSAMVQMGSPHTAQ